MSQESMDDRNGLVPFRDLDGKLLHPDIRRKIIRSLKETVLDGEQARTFVDQKLKEFKETGTV